nr:MAG TPA: hypothetical protein [Caudoviricetes sp.]
MGVESSLFYLCFIAKIKYEKRNNFLDTPSN